MNEVTLSASANVGVGLWTSICRAFASIFGVESKNFLNKQNRILKSAEARLKSKFAELGPGYELRDYRVTWGGALSVTVSALAVKSNAESSQEESLKEKAKPKVCPQCGAPIEAEMFFCGECGHKLK